MPMLALMVLALLATACTDTDQLTPMRQPISFGATLLQPAASGATTTRATTQGSFAQGDRIALRIGGVVKPYTYDATTGRFTSPDPFYWPVGVTRIDNVLAWYPYSDQLPLNFRTSDSQHDDAEHAASDFLSTGSVTLTRASAAAPGSLTFAHRTAQMEFRIKADPRTLPGGAKITGVTLNDVGLYTSVDGTDGILSRVSGSLPSPISAHLRSATSATEALYEALIVPQVIAYGLPVSLSITATTPTGEKKFKGFLSGKFFEGGMSYAYNVTLYADRITITPDTGDVPWQEGSIALPDGYDLTVSNAKELKEFAELVNSGGMIPGTDVRAYDARVLQTAEIDLKEIGNWTPIGTSAMPFRGAYNGNGYTISNLTIEGGGRRNGLFGYVEGRSATSPAVLTGIHLRNVQMDVDTKGSFCSSGAIVGETYKATVISFCTTQGKIKTKCSGTQNSTGGIAGGIDVTDVINHCRTSVVIDAAASTTTTTQLGTGCKAGGIAGSNYGTILACESSGSGVSAEGYNAYAGGIAGWTAANAKVYFCASQMKEATATSGAESIHVGGLIGYNQRTLTSSYARTQATAGPGGANSVQAGAIVGYASFGRTESYCIGTSANDEGTSGLRPAAGNIIYKQDATDTDIYNLVSAYSSSVTISTTTYDASRFPAYGIELTEQTFEASTVWALVSGSGGSSEIRLRSLPPISAAP